MTVAGREIRPWYSGIAAVLLGLLILFTLTAFPAAKYFAVEAVNAALYYPEKPVLYIRGIIQLSGSRVLERATLRERVKNLELQNRAMAEALQRAALNVPPSEYSYVSALVTLRYPEDWWQEFRIDKGEKDGVKEGAAVTSEGFLVGRVSRVGSDYAWVQLLTSSAFLMAAAVDQTRDLGVINGDDAGHLRLLYIPEDRRLKSGMTISTSLTNDKTPPGIPVGTIISIGKDKEGYTEVNLNAGAHLTQLYNVEVFKGEEREKK